MLKRDFHVMAAKESKIAFNMCHASNLIKLDDGTIITVFFAGSHEGNSDTSIYMCRAKAGESSEPVKIAGSDEAHWNPVLFAVSDEELVLFYKVGNIIATWRTMIVRSYDRGLTWTEPEELVPGDIGGRGPVRNKPVRISSGAILCPGSLENGPWRAFLDISYDNLRTLEKSAEISYQEEGNFSPLNKGIEVSEQSFSGKGVIQPTIWEDDKGVHVLLRSTYGKVIRADSIDGGRTFLKPYPVNMDNNNSGLDAVYVNSKLYLVCNPVGGNWADRTPLTLFSSDDGINFKEESVLAKGAGEFSYPCIRAYDKELYISYTYSRKNIAIDKFTIN